MQLINSLMAGMQGATNGVAQLFVYGTTTPAVYYADFEGTVSATSQDDLPLDSNGGAVVYVNQLVDIKVFDANGVLLRDFTDGDAAPNVEVQSIAFTGTNRTTGVLAAGEPTTLQAVLDLWKASSGTIDWKVLFNGTPTNLQTAIASVAGLFFNVKDPAYGATGNGASDDTTPIQNCINAAGAVKGIVIFPAGTYNVGVGGLSIPAGVSLWGVGAAGSIIRIDASSGDTLTYTGNGGSPDVVFREIRGLQITARQTNSGSPVRITGAAGVIRLAIVNSVLGGSLNTGVCLNVTLNDSHWILVDGSWLTNSSATNGVVVSNLTFPRVFFRQATFQVSGSAGTFNGAMVTVRNALISSSVFDTSGLVAGTYAALVIDGTAGTGPKVTLTGNDFIPGSGGSVSTAVQIQNANEATTAVAEAGNIFRATWTAVFAGFTAQSNIPSILAVTRESMGKNITDNTASVNVLADQFGYTALTRTTTAAQTVTTAIGSGGANFLLIVFNNSGGGLGNITFGAGFASGTPAITGLANGKLAMQKFKAVYVNGAAAWVPVSPVISGI